MLQKNKYAKHGGFHNRIFVKHIAHPAGSAAEHYCLANPEKYPEITTE